MARKFDTQYWLAELDIHGNPKLIDGSHARAAEANKAAYLIRSLGLGKPDRKFAVAKVELYECKPSSVGVNQSALTSCKTMIEFGRKP